jgi:hypothetical protein
MTAAKTYTRAKISTDSVQLDQPTDVVNHGLVAETGIALSGAGIETEGPTQNVKAALSEEQFMQNMLEVSFAEAGNENEHQFVEGGVNGERFCFRRGGDTVKIKRSHLAVIASAKQERLKQTKITLPDGSMGYEERMVLQPVYPFQVVYDPAGARGITWIRQLMQSR